MAIVHPIAQCHPVCLPEIVATIWGSGRAATEGAARRVQRIVDLETHRKFS